MFLCTQYESKKEENRMSISDSQVFIALFIALMTGILAIRLGVALYD